MRPSGGTNDGPCVVVDRTNAMIARFAAPSFHASSGSFCAAIADTPLATTTSATSVHVLAMDRMHHLSWHGRVGVMICLTGGRGVWAKGPRRAAGYACADPSGTFAVVAARATKSPRPESP